MKDVLDRMVLLEKTEIFSRLKLNELNRIAEILEEEDYDQGEILFEQGDQGNSAYLILSGRVEIYLKQDKKIQKIINLKPGDFFGEMALIDGEPRSASARCSVKSRLYSLDRRSFLSVLQQYPSISLGLISTFSSRLREGNKKNIQLKKALGDFQRSYRDNQDLLEELQ